MKLLERLWHQYLSFTALFNFLHAKIIMDITFVCRCGLLQQRSVDAHKNGFLSIQTCSPMESRYNNVPHTFTRLLKVINSSPHNGNSQFRRLL